MADADKENDPTAPAAAAATSKRPFASRSSSNNSSSSTPPTRSPLQPVTLAFPASDPDEDRDVLASDGKTLKSKRSALFYPSAGLAAKSNQQPFSRSAAKRDSIMALGSIGYLQHLYTKQGIANKNRPLSKGAMTLAIGPAGEAMMSGHASLSRQASSASTVAGPSTPEQIAEEDHDSDLELPPSPQAGSYARPKYLDVARPLEADTQALRALLIADLDRLSTAWNLSDWIASNAAVTNIKQLLPAKANASEEGPGTSSVDLPAIIDVTTKAIRSVRSYVLALPQRSKIPTTSPYEPSGRDRFRRQASFSGVSRPGQTGISVPTRTSEILHHDVGLQIPGRDVGLSLPTTAQPLGRRLSNSQQDDDGDHLGIIRKAALEMLSALKEMEEKNRIATLGDSDAADLQLAEAADRLSTSEAFDPDESSVTVLANSISDTGYLYRSLNLSDYDAERKVLQRYLVVVDLVLSSLAVPPQDTRRHSSSGSMDARGIPPPTKAMVSSDATPSIHIDAVSDRTRSGWAQAWMESDLSAAERVSAFMIDHCGSEPNSRLDRLIAAQHDLEALLPLLSDGHLLCRAFNEAVRRSDKPWGYISSREIHDLEAEEAALLLKESLRAKQAQEDGCVKFQTRADRKGASEGASSTDEPALEPATVANRPGWNFRKSENLRTWAAALKLRHQISTTATRALAAAKPSTSGPTHASRGMNKLALQRRVASESQAAPSDRSSSRTIDFDPARVARREAGWQQMLTALLLAWIEAVAQEQG